MKKNKQNLPEVIDKRQIELAQDSGPMAQTSMFLASGGKFEDIEKMMELQDRYDEKQAKKAFIRAMAKFKETPVVIIKDKDNKQYNSKYSSIGATVNACLPRMGECKLSHKWTFDESDQKFIQGTCVVTHEEGFSDSATMRCPLDVSGNKNPIQQIKSTRTYLKIETFASVMGLASSEDIDDDGTAAGAKTIDEKQVSQVTDMVNSIDGFTMEAFLSWAKLEKLEYMPVYDFGKNMNALKARAKANAN